MIHTHHQTRRLPGALATGMFWTLITATATAAEPPGSLLLIGERPAIEKHIEQSDIDAGHYTLKDLEIAGQRLFDAQFNILDGHCRTRDGAVVMVIRG